MQFTNRLRARATGVLLTGAVLAGLVSPQPATASTVMTVKDIGGTDLSGEPRDVLVTMTSGDAAPSDRFPEPIPVPGRTAATRLVADVATEDTLGGERVSIVYDSYTAAGTTDYAGVVVRMFDSDGSEVLTYRSGRLVIASEETRPCWPHNDPICLENKMDNSTCFASGYYCEMARDLEDDTSGLSLACTQLPGTVDLPCQFSVELILSIPGLSCAGAANMCRAGGSLDRLQCEIVYGGEELFNVDGCDLHSEGTALAKSLDDFAMSLVEHQAEMARQETERQVVRDTGVRRVTEHALKDTPAQPIAQTTHNEVEHVYDTYVHDAYCGGMPYC